MCCHPAAAWLQTPIQSQDVSRSGQCT
jgi:hypothetical protein